jgi:ABC-type nitrate/sulfonate/bicarbonate transport system permease component
MRGLFRYVPLVLFVAVWQAVDSGLVDRHFLPSFRETIGALWELARSGEITWNL